MVEQAKERESKTTHATRECWADFVNICLALNLLTHVKEAVQNLTPIPILRGKRAECKTFVFDAYMCEYAFSLVLLSQHWPVTVQA